MNSLRKLQSALLLSALFYLTAKSQPLCTGTPEFNTIVSASQTICAGSAASLSLSSTYTNSGIVYQWYSSLVSQVGPYSPIPGATLSAYASPTLASTIYYKVVISCTNSGLSYTANYPIYVVSCAPPCSGTPGSCSIVPLSQTVCTGNVASMGLSTTYTDSGITYQWGSSTLQTGPFTPIAGATLSTYTTAPLNSNQFFNVIITCTNSNLTYTTSQAVSVVSCTYCSGTPGSNSIVAQSPTVCTGSVANLSLANTYTNSGISYQWLTSSVSAAGPFNSIPGATLSTFNSSPLFTSTYFNVVITCTNSGLSFTTNQLITVVSCTTPCSGVPASNSIVPQFQSLCIGDLVNMYLANTYTNGGLSYQWGSSTVQAGPYTTIPGATLSSYTSPTLAGSVYFNVIITCTNSGQSYTTSNAITVLPCTYCAGIPASNTILPLSHTVCEGGGANMGLALTYTTTGMVYQWESSAVSLAGPFNVIPGATLSTYSSPTLAANMFYKITINCSNSGLSFSTTHAVTVVTCSPTGFESREENLAEFLIYPNPASEFCIIKLNRKDFDKQTILVLRNILGEVVFKRKLIEVNEYRLQSLDYSAGLYFVECYTNGLLFGKKKLLIE